MKSLNVLFLAVILMSLVATSCRKTNPGEETTVESKPMDEISVNPDFNWETTKLLEVRLTGTVEGVVYIKPVEGDYWYHKGMLNSGSVFTTKLNVPSYLDEVKLSFRGMEVILPVIGTSLEYNFK